MTTTTKDRATKNIALETQRFMEFCANVMVPVLSDIVTAPSVCYREPSFTTIRSINELYGNSAAKCFAILFKRLSKGGINRQNEAYKASWVPNIQAISLMSQWRNETNEVTARSLLKFLQAHGLQELEWDKRLKAFIPADFVKSIREAIEDNEEPDDVDYGSMLVALKKLQTT